MPDPNKQIPMCKFDKKDVTISAIKTKYEGFFKLDEYHIKHKLFSNKISDEFTREIFERGDAVVIILYDPVKDKLLLIEQFRVGALRSQKSPWLLEFVAGMFGKNENPIEVAVRESEEEAGITIKAENVKYIMKYLSSPGGMSESIYLYWSTFESTQVIPGSVYGLDEENEDILLHLVSLEKALALLDEGKIINASTIIGLQWLALKYKNL